MKSYAFKAKKGKVEDMYLTQFGENYTVISIRRMICSHAKWQARPVSDVCPVDKSLWHTNERDKHDIHIK
jgi:hypothetical protein